MGKDIGKGKERVNNIMSRRKHEREEEKRAMAKVVKRKAKIEDGGWILVQQCIDHWCFFIKTSFSH